VGGPDELTYVEIMSTYGELVGKHPRIIPVPVLTPRLSSYWLRLVTTVPVNVARALIDGLSQDVVADDQRLAQLIPQELLGFRAAAAVALDADRRHAIPARWVEGAVVCREFRPEYSYYAKQQGASADTTATSAALWHEICKFGDHGDFFHARWLWWLRRSLDWMVGGPSFRRKRRDPDRLRVGDVVDAWRVIGVKPNRQLTLVMEMRAPGAGVLEYSIEDVEGGRRVSVEAYFHPAGAWGLAYWYALLPFHAYIFRGMIRTIRKRASGLTSANES
jgi:hypothetical protein